MNETLANCPWCNSDGATIHPPPPDAGGLHMLVSRAPYYGHCDRCGADGPPADTEAEASALWNARPHAREIVEPLKQARFLFGSIIEAGPSLPSRQRWAGIHRLASQMPERLTAAIAATRTQPATGDAAREILAREFTEPYAELIRDNAADCPETIPITAALNAIESAMNSGEREAVTERLRSAYMRVQRAKTSGELDMQPIWDVINLAPDVLAILDMPDEFERDLAAEAVEDTRTQPATGDAARDLFAENANKSSAQIERRIAAARMVLGMSTLQTRFADRDGEWSLSDLFNAIESALRSPGGEEWQPIETARKNGTEILCFGLYYGKPVRFVALWNGIEWYAGWGGAIQPTHWRPLPAPPALDPGKGEA